MKSARSALVVAIAASLAAGAVSFAKDDSTKPAPGAEKPAAKASSDDDSDKKARAILAKAAVRQNAGDLVEPGRLESFHVVFHIAKFRTEKTNDKGEVVSTQVETDDDGLVVDWKQGSVKTQVTVDGRPTTKAHYFTPVEGSWISDGESVSSLAGEDRKADFDQLEFQRRVVDQLLEVAFVGRLATDKSRWRVLDDASVPNAVAVERTPPADAPDATRLQLWIEKTGDGEYGDVVQAAMPPKDEGGATLIYEFKYEPEFVAVRRKNAEGVAAPDPLRFPSEVRVSEQKKGESKRSEALFVSGLKVDINTVADLDFAPPKVKPRKK